MNFKDHSQYKGLHAFLSPSSPYWTNYDDEKLATRYSRALAAERGVRLHAYAMESISLGQKLPKSQKTLNMYINDAIGYRMTPEQVLYFSDNCFGTADAIAYNEKTRVLRIHDLKTGVTQGSMRQLEVYAALFCLEYAVNHEDIEIELRIYQNDEIIVHEPTGEDIQIIIDRIVSGDKIINKTRELEVGL